MMKLVIGPKVMGENIIEAKLRLWREISNDVPFVLLFHFESTLHSHTSALSAERGKLTHSICCTVVEVLKVMACSTCFG